MKKIICLMVVISINLAILPLQINAKVAPGTPLGDVLYTDIEAYIDGYPIQSYNINGNTYVIAEDLLYYGFDVRWGAKEKLLVILPERTALPGNYTTPYKHKKTDVNIGEVAAKYYATEIGVLIDETSVNGYNIGGFTCICLDDLAAFWGTSYVWDSITRTIKLTTAKELIGKSSYIDLQSEYDMHENIKNSLVHMQNGVNMLDFGSASAIYNYNCAVSAQKEFTNAYICLENAYSIAVKFSNTEDELENISSMLKAYAGLINYDINVDNAVDYCNYAVILIGKHLGLI